MEVAILVISAIGNVVPQDTPVQMVVAQSIVVGHIQTRVVTVNAALLMIPITTVQVVCAW